MAQKCGLSTFSRWGKLQSLSYDDLIKILQEKDGIMNYQGQDPNQGQYPGSGQYGGGYQQPQQPPPTDPYSGQQYGTGYGTQQPGYGQPGYQQPGYQQPGQGYQPPYGTPQQGPTSMGMSQNVAAGLSYVLFWITGLIFFLMEKQNRFVRFHAMQSIIFFGGVTILNILINIVVAALHYSAFATAIGCIGSIVGLAAFVVWIVLLINAFQGKYFKLPVIGDYAERYANQGTTM
jgi:uncharacterized membrane protein